MHLNLKNRNKNLFVIVSLVFVLYVIVLIIRPKPVDWSLSFSKDDSIPFGTEILYKELSCLYDDSTITVNKQPIYNFLEDSLKRIDDLVFINNEFKPDHLDLESLLKKVSKGSDAFVSAIEFADELKDTLGFTTKESFVFNLKEDSLVVNFTNEQLKTDNGYVYKKAFNKVAFNVVDTLHTTILGVNDKNEALFIKIKFGKGNFYMHTNPLTFSNYVLLKRNNYECAFKALSYLSGRQVVWDEYYKAKPRPSYSVVRYILSQPALRYGWYLTLFGILTYLIFGAKRRQRLIPVIEPPVNSSLSFIKTVGQLYFKKGDHYDIAQKKFTYFLEFLRLRYYIDTRADEADLINEITEKLDVPRKVVKKLFSLSQRLKMNLSYTEDDLLELSKNIEFIYNNGKYKYGK